MKVKSYLVNGDSSFLLVSLYNNTGTSVLLRVYYCILLLRNLVVVHRQKVKCHRDTHRYIDAKKRSQNFSICLAKINLIKNKNNNSK